MWRRLSRSCWRRSKNPVFSMMNETSMRRPHLFWRWALIGSETLVACYIVFVKLAQRREDIISPSPLIDLVVGIALAFLFFGSPFLARSQGALAILGWLIAVAAIIAPML